jgi:hypothetical protein
MTLGPYTMISPSSAPWSTTELSISILTFGIAAPTVPILYLPGLFIVAAGEVSVRP